MNTELKIEIEIPDNLYKFLEAIATFQKVDPKTYIKEYVEYYANDVIQNSLDTLTYENSLFDITTLEKAYNIKIKI